jgi:translocation protein SEC66
VEKANAFAPNWGQTIFQSASEMAQNTQIRDRLADILATAPSERAWWDKRRATIQSEFMKELDEERSAKGTSVSGSVTGLMTPADTERSMSVTSSMAGDDAVFVEGNGPVDGSKKGRKKKGKA